MKKLLFVGTLLIAFPAIAQMPSELYGGQALGQNNARECPDRRNIALTVYSDRRIKYENDQGNTGWTDLKPDGSFTLITAPDNPTRRFEMNGQIDGERKSISGKFYFSNAQGRCHYTFTLPKK